MLAWVLGWFVVVPGATGQSPAGTSPTGAEVIDIRGIWDNGGLNKKKALARGLDPKAIKTPTKIRNVSPKYPEAAKQAGQMGTVGLECRIEPDGVPRECKVVGPVAPALDAEALGCVTQWRFKPLTVGGEPKPALVNFTVNFRLN